MFLWLVPKLRNLSPVDRLSEVMFGLLMTLTFTCTLAFTVDSGTRMTAIMLAALGCNVAWGLIDGGMYLIRSIVSRARRQHKFEAILAASPEARVPLVEEWMTEATGITLEPETAHNFVTYVLDQPSHEKAYVVRDDVRAAIAVTLLVIAATFPPLVPFLFIEDVTLAVRISNLIALFLMICIGYQLDKHIAPGIFLMRWLIPLFGVGMVVIAIIFGG